MDSKLVLASASPRRRELLLAAGLEFEVVPVPIDESIRANEGAIAFARRMAREKAEATLASLPSGCCKVIGADTIVNIRGRVLGKPATPDEAGQMLRLLSGDTHQVVTGVCLLSGDSSGSIATDLRHATTSVRFRALSPAQIAAYVATGEPMDKAGAYAIQGGAADFVEHFEGDYDNVVGLPVSLVVSMLRPVL